MRDIIINESKVFLRRYAISLSDLKFIMQILEH
jgi:hypothetical protein